MTSGRGGSPHPPRQSRRKRGGCGEPPRETYLTPPSFAGYPFYDTLRAELEAAGYRTPTPIQARAIGPALEGKDLIGAAQTGTGKTAAFALPIIHRLHRKLELGALVLAPTRELAKQIVGVFNDLGSGVGIRVAQIVGGMPVEGDWKALSSWPNVVVATPGRLIDHLEQGSVGLGEIEIFVIDEADRMHDMGFIPQIRRIIAALPAERQTMMFTATMPPDVERIVRRNMRDPVKIQVGPASRPVEQTEQRLYYLEETEKTRLLQSLLRKETGRVLVFVRTKRGVDRLARRVHGRHLRLTRLHGDRVQADRDDSMEGFREGRYRVLIATDIAARGIDVADIEHVINYDFPHSPEDYIHRIGRTARLTAPGRATSFVTPHDRRHVAAVERLIDSKLPLTPAPDTRVGSRHHGSRKSGSHTPHKPGARPPATAGGGGGAEKTPGKRRSRRRRRRRR